MKSLDKYDSAFIESFDINVELLGDNLVYQSIPEWDSVGHMTLMSLIESKFDIMLEMDDILDFSSYEKGKEIVHKYGISI